jgi:predicted dienelactone hydrolase
MMVRGRLALAALLLCSLVAVVATQNRIDVVTPAAPELAAFGPHDIGVRTIVVTDPDRADILNTKQGGPTARYARRLTLEVWYPSTSQPGDTAGTQYRTLTRDPGVTATIHGRARRDAAPARNAAFPLVIISHGYPGNRYLMSHLGENLASKGFVTVSIDHRDSTYDDQQAFASTLYNRPLDQLFVLNEIDRLGRADSGSFLARLVDASSTGLVGYSMGGYGVINAVGGGYSEASVASQTSPPNRLLAERAASNAAYRASIDPRIKAAIAIAPWGMQTGFWDADGLEGIRIPVMFVAGSVDEVAGYEKGTRALYTGAVNADRYLLTFINAGHNAAAPYPAPAEAMIEPTAARPSPFTHYGDAVWDTTRMNNILQHFATAYFRLHLKREGEMQAFFDLVPNGKDGVYSLDREGKPTSQHTSWKGFKRGTAVGLVLERAAPRR